MGKKKVSMATKLMQEHDKNVGIRNAQANEQSKKRMGIVGVFCTGTCLSLKK